MDLAEHALYTPDQYITDSTAELTIALFMKSFKKMVHVSQEDVHQIMSSGTQLMLIATCVMPTLDPILPRPNVLTTDVPSIKSRP